VDGAVQVQGNVKVHCDQVVHVAFELHSLVHLVVVKAAVDLALGQEDHLVPYYLHFLQLVKGEADNTVGQAVVIDVEEADERVRVEQDVEVDVVLGVALGADPGGDLGGGLGGGLDGEDLDEGVDEATGVVVGGEVIEDEEAENEDLAGVVVADVVPVDVKIVDGVIVGGDFVDEVIENEDLADEGIANEVLGGVVGHGDLVDEVAVGVVLEDEVIANVDFDEVIESAALADVEAANEDPAGAAIASEVLADVAIVHEEVVGVTFADEKDVTDADNFPAVGELLAVEKSEHFHNLETDYADDVAVACPYLKALVENEGNSEAAADEVVVVVDHHNPAAVVVQDVVVETWVAESAATAGTWAAVGPPDSQAPGCEDDSRARAPAGAAPSDWGPGEAASAKAGATSSSCYAALLGLRFFWPCTRRSNQHLCKEAHPCTVARGA
jgi:hypothetical protein